MDKIENKPLKIKKRGEDGYKLISVRIKEDTLAELDKIANETNYSRNELINLILKHGVNNVIIEWNFPQSNIIIVFDWGFFIISLITNIININSKYFILYF